MPATYQQLLRICLLLKLSLVLAITTAGEELPEDSRINGGQQMNESVPFQVSMQLLRRGRWRHFCSGSIVSEQHVLTAAHCVDKLQVANMTVLGGTLNWQVGGHRHRVLAKHVHPQYAMSPRIVNDIALLKVSPPFALQLAEIGAVTLPGSERIGRHVAVRLTGWGSTTPSSASAQVPQRLQVLHYQTISNEECAKRGFRVTPNELCALSAPGQGACMGDSGGPLVLASRSQQQQLVGIVSYGSSTCAQGKPDVYTRVSSFLPYISKVLNQDLA